MTPKFRAWGVERYPGLKQPASKMHRNVSVVTTYPEGITFILTNFSMWGDDEYSGSIIDDAILMQSTGLKDKNGKEIFEGDIITDGHTLGVLRNHQTLGFYMVDEKGKENFLSDTVDTEGFEEAKEFMKNSIKIIGNIYENPELLEDE